MSDVWVWGVCGVGIGVLMPPDHTNPRATTHSKPHNTLKPPQVTDCASVWADTLAAAQSTARALAATSSLNGPSVTLMPEGTGIGVSSAVVDVFSSSDTFTVEVCFLGGVECVLCVLCVYCVAVSILPLPITTSRVLCMQHHTHAHITHTHTLQDGARTLVSFTPAPNTLPDGVDPTSSNPIPVLLQYFADTTLLQQSSMGTCGSGSPSNPARRRLQQVQPTLGGGDTGLLGGGVLSDEPVYFGAENARNTPSQDGVLGGGVSYGASLASFDNPQMVTGAASVPSAGSVSLLMEQPLLGRDVGCWFVPTVGQETFTEGTVEAENVVCDTAAAGTVQVWCWCVE